MVTWSSTLVYSCECVCLVLLFYLVNVFFCVLCCLMFIDMFHTHMQLMQSLDQWNKYMYVCKRERHFVVELCYCHWIFMLEGFVILFEITCSCFLSMVVHTSRTHHAICCCPKGTKTSPLTKGCSSWIKWVEFRII